MITTRIRGAGFSNGPWTHCARLIALVGPTRQTVRREEPQRATSFRVTRRLLGCVFGVKIRYINRTLEKGARHRSKHFYLRLTLGTLCHTTMTTNGTATTSSQEPAALEWLLKVRGLSQSFSYFLLMNGDDVPRHLLVVPLGWGLAQSGSMGRVFRGRCRRADGEQSTF